MTRNSGPQLGNANVRQPHKEDLENDSSRSGHLRKENRTTWESLKALFTNPKDRTSVLTEALFDIFFYVILNKKKH